MILGIFLISEVSAQSPLTVIGELTETDLPQVFRENGIPFVSYPTVQEGLDAVQKNSGVFILHNAGGVLTETEAAVIKRKQLRVFLEFPEQLPFLKISGQMEIVKERGVVTTETIPGLEELDILSLNTRTIKTLADPHINSSEKVLMVLGKVAGFERAEYGISDIDTYPLLFKEGDNFMISTAIVSSAATGRYGPAQRWELLFDYLLKWLVESPVEVNTWPVAVAPAFGPADRLSQTAFSNAIKEGAEWFFDAKLLVHPSWEQLYHDNTGENGKDVVNPAVDDSLPLGNGSRGILEGHASRINPDGTQPYRWWIRGDCQAEVAFALASAYTVHPDEKYKETAENLLDYLFEYSNLRSGERDDPNSPSFGLIGWATTDPDAYYGDDNARLLLSLIGASAHLDSHQWDEKLLEGILGNYRTAGTKGFRGPWFRDAQMQKTSWQELGQRDIVNIHPHYESWLWALYLWLYDKTGYQAFYDSAEEAITITMDAFPEWKWTNGIQQEYSRMLLPLAWLVQVEDTPQHRKWLKTVAEALLTDITDTGAIPEKLGTPGMGRYEKIKSNAEYGTKEAPLISDETDLVADMLYTMNFALFSLNEAAAATGDPYYKEAASKTSDFLIRIQIESSGIPDLDGGWFRAFDIKNWEYWASNADSDWGPWGTLTGWTQSWILNGLINEQQETNLWDSSKNHYQNGDFRNLAQEKIKQMLNK